MAHVRSISKSVCHGCGTLEYIALEYLKDPLKKKSEPFDVYGFAISAWEIFSEKRPYYDFCDKRLISVSVAEKGMRPQISDIGENIPQMMVNLILDCWQPDGRKRPTFGDIVSIIFTRIPLMKGDITRCYKRLTEDKSNKSIKPKGSENKFTPKPVCEKKQTSDTEIHACIAGFRQVRSRLASYLDPEYGLLPCLAYKGIITDVEYNFLEDFKSDSTKTYMELNDQLLLRFIDPKFESCCHLFREVLEENDQQHIVKYIMSAGQDSDSEDRVLNCEEISIIDNNMFFLVNLINPYRRNFLYRLVAKQCITNRHKEKIEKFPEASMKMDELLKILKRRRYRDFRNFKVCLHDTMQHKLVDILEQGGIVTVSVKLHKREDRKVIESKSVALITGYVDETDEIDNTLTTEQVEFIKDILRDLEEYDIQLIGNSAWRSIAVFFQCKTEHSFVVLERVYTSG